MQGSISHANVVRVLDSNLGADPPWFIMELGDRTLKEMMEKGQLTPELRRRALFDILSGLEEIHAQGYRHRDLKPANILYLKGERERFAISDFGLGAPREGESTTLTATGVQGGTEAYSAPELARSFRRATAAADIYSFGAILHDLFVGKRRTPYARQHGPGAIGAVIEKCTEMLPARRYRDIAALRADLFAALENTHDDELSVEDETALELLSKPNLSSDDWEAIFERIDEAQDEGRFQRSLVVGFNEKHLTALSVRHPELLQAYVLHVLEYVMHTRGKLGFDFCDVLADQMGLSWDFADVEGTAILALAMLLLGTSHNRWYVERRFLRMARHDGSDAIMRRMIVEARVRGIDLTKHLRQLLSSLQADVSHLHRLLQSELE